MSRPDGLRRDRDGSLIEDLVVDLRAGLQPHRCRRGWLGEDRAGRPIPCPECRAATLAKIARLRCRATDPAGTSPVVTEGNRRS